MSDDTSEEQERLEAEMRRRREAEGTAADLARMGIDPRSVGLGAEPSSPDVPRDSDAQATGEPGDGRAQVVQLRPEVDPAPPTLLSPSPTASPSGPAPAGGPVPPVDGETTRHPVQDLLARTTPPAPTGGSRRWMLRAVARGLSTPDAAESVAADREVVEAVRRRQSDRRVVAFVAGKGGVGCTSVAVGVASCFMALREDRTALLDVQQGTVPLSALLFASDRVDLAGAGALEVDEALPITSSGLGVVDAVEWGLRPSRRDLAQALERVGADHTFALLDAGASAGEAAHASVARADQVVVVTGPGSTGELAHTAAMERVSEVNPAAAEQAIHVVVCAHEESYARVQREAVSRLRGAGAAAVVAVPPDPHLASGAPYDPALVAAPTREALVRLSAAIALGGRR